MNTVSPGRLINYVVHVLHGHGFVPHMQADESTTFRRPNSYAAVRMTTDENCVTTHKDCDCPIMIGGTFVEEFLRTGLFTLEMKDGKCVIASI